MRRVIGDRRARIYEYLDYQAVQELVKEHWDGKKNRRLLIWSLVVFVNWCERFM